MQAVVDLQREVDDRCRRWSPRAPGSRSRCSSRPRRSRRRPWPARRVWFDTTSLMFTENSFLVSGAHSTSSHLSGSLRVFATTGQSWVWMTMPRPFLMKPMIGSPGIGWQHLANCTAMPSEPRMMTGPALPACLRLAAPAGSSLRAMTMASCLPRPMSASTSCRDLGARSLEQPLPVGVRCRCARRCRARVSAWSSRRSPSCADSSYCMVLRKWRMWGRALPVTT